MKTWDTDALPPADRLPYWRDVLCEAFTALATEPQESPHRRSVVKLHEFADVNGVALTSFSQVITHGLPEVRRSNDAFFFINYQLQGECRAEQDGRQVRAGAGQFYMVDTTRPYHLDFTETFHTLSFRFPQRLLAPLLGDPRRLTARGVDADTVVGGLAAGHMRELLRCAADVPAGAGASLAQSLAHLVALAIGRQLPSGLSAQAEARQAIHASIARYVREHSTDPEISVASVAARFRIAPRTVQAIFAERGSCFTQTVLECRLDVARQALTRAGASVTRVAYDCGFGDLTYFGRAFRRRFGCSPREWQRSSGAHAPSPAIAISESASPPAAQSMGVERPA